MGIRSGMMYTAGIISVGASFASWVLSKEVEQDIARADRWGLFIGEWAPTFFAMGVALRIEETRSELIAGHPEEEMRREERMGRRMGGRMTERV
ncbi:hypothetical protein Sme01_36740 [Sphaerisporangium melleum]|uniref:Uncharacterized protein n=1 Tax=Sphaerisporangium melleum TaxID=321316 RepID=A0A917RNB2_9ACTN|nr:hypothetical protein [Sphaerisporangium melleum]GGL16654.1 hypothetical protein GCM10007964_68290 [Sphaerisporangium melleum]GII71198.1 hypothetical protein Sme01_36740 [Sphaerisporangium melleum]